VRRYGRFLVLADDEGVGGGRLLEGVGAAAVVGLAAEAEAAAGIGATGEERERKFHHRE
jgi:hypothetical protein